MKRSFVQINGVLYEKGKQPLPEGPMVMGDIKPYISMHDGTLITSRSQHRAHLRNNNLQELGNDPSIMNPKTPTIPDCSPQKRKELIRSQIDAMSHREFKAAIKRDVDRVKWNSND